MIEFTVPGIPVPKGRPRFGKGRTYTPADTVAAERTVAIYARRACRKPLTGPLRLGVVFYVPIPKDSTKARFAARLSGSERPITKPDLDNYLKLVLDACNRIVYADDNQVVEIVATKWYSDKPNTLVTVEPIE